MRRPERSSTRSRREASIDRALWAVFVVSLLLTLFLAFWPDPPTIKAIPRSDKVFHALAFASIYGSFLLAGVWRPRRGPGKHPTTALPAAMSLLALGIVIELAQGELMRRDADVLDVGAELVGMAIAFGVVRALGWGRG